MKYLKPMLLESTEHAFDDAEWLFEYKWDGFRALIAIEGEIKIISRNGNNLLPHFPELQCLKNYFKANTIIDGEIVAYNGQKGCFSEILRRTRSARAQIPVKFILFDILYAEGKDLTKVPLHIRKSLLPELNEEYIFTSAYVEGAGKKVFAAALQNNYEGIVAKKKSSLYYPGKRSAEWLKIKCFVMDKFLVKGLRIKNAVPHTLLITDTQESFLQEILLSGTHASRMEWLKLLKNFILKQEKDLIYIKPVLAANISYLEKTSDGKLRHAKIKDILPLGG